MKKLSLKDLQVLLDKSKFSRHYGFRVVRSSEDACTIELPHKPLNERPGGVINGPALMAAADCAMWLAIKNRIGIDKDALTSELNTAFLNGAKGDVYCTARILKFGRRSIYGTAECHSKSGQIFSHHTLTFMPI